MRRCDWLESRASTSVCGVNGGAGSKPPLAADRGEAPERARRARRRPARARGCRRGTRRRARPPTGASGRRRSRRGVKDWMCSGGPEHGAAERVVAERGAVDQVLGDDRRRVLGARDLLDDDAALAVELLGVDPRAADEVGQQVDRPRDDLGPAGEVEGDDVVRRVGVEHGAHLLGGLVDLAVVVVELAALEHEVLEEVGHPVLLGALGAGAGLEGDEGGHGARALELDAVQGKAVGEGLGGDRRHALRLARMQGFLPGRRSRLGTLRLRDGSHRQPPTPRRSGAPPQRPAAPRGGGDRRPALGHQALLEDRDRRRGRDLRGPARRVRVRRRRVRARASRR